MPIIVPAGTCTNCEQIAPRLWISVHYRLLCEPCVEQAIEDIKPNTDD